MLIRLVVDLKHLHVNHQLIYVLSEYSVLVSALAKLHQPLFLLVEASSATDLVDTEDNFFV